MTTDEFKTGEYVVYLNGTYRIKNDGKHYILFSVNGNTSTPVVHVPYGSSRLRLWTIQDARDGDILIDKSNSRESPFIFKETKPSDIKTDVLNPLTVLGYCGIGGAGFTKGSGWGDTVNCTYYPATKEQRDLLFQKMKEAGYEWDAEKKKLKKIEEEVNGEDYGIDSLFHAQSILEKTLGEVEGYQSDDGILEHKCAISSIKELRKMKQQNWSEEDKYTLECLIDYLVTELDNSYLDEDKEIFTKEIKLLEYIKDRGILQLVYEWNQEDNKYGLEKRSEQKPAEKPV